VNIVLASNVLAPVVGDNKHESSKRFSITIGQHAHFWLHVSTTVLEQALIHALTPIESVNAIYTTRDHEGVLMVFVVVREHDDDVYEQVLAAEAPLAERFGGQFELRIRAHQGRNPGRAVPVQSLPLYLSDEK
jgi:hypothetical protein